MSFLNAMEGAALAAKRDFDIAIIGAWHTEAFARTKRLKKMSTYLGISSGSQAKSSIGCSEALQMFHSLKGKGVPVDIKRLN